MPNKELKGIEGARANRVTNRRTKTDWRLPDNKTCLLSDCDNPVFSDGKIYYSLCLGCLQQKQLGPFYPRKPEVKDPDWPDRGSCSASVVANSLFYKQGQQK